MKRLLVLFMWFAVSIGAGVGEAQPRVGICLAGSKDTEKERGIISRLIEEKLPSGVGAAHADEVGAVLGQNFLNAIDRSVLDEELVGKLEKSAIQALVLGGIRKVGTGRYVMFLRILAVGSDMREEKLKLDKKALFKAPISHAANLDKGRIPVEFRDEFSRAGQGLAGNSQVKAVTPGREWTIRDPIRKAEYQVIPEARELRIYWNLSYTPQEITSRVSSFVQESSVMAWVKENADRPAPDPGKTAIPDSGKTAISDSGETADPGKTADTGKTAAPDTAKTAGAVVKTGWFGEEMPAGLGRSRVPGEYIFESDRGVMVRVPAGEFYCETQVFSGESLDKKLDIPAYYIDKYEVTNRQYCIFLNSVDKYQDDAGQWFLVLESFEGFDILGERGGLALEECLEIESPYCGIEAAEGGFQTKPGAEHLPAVEVSWYGALAYARWCGKSLPSEMQWEKAFRGGLKIPSFAQAPPPLTDNPLPERPYPWGIEPPDALFYRLNCGGEEDGHPWASRVFAFSGLGDSPYGCSDMLGNAWEWCRKGAGNDREQADGKIRTCRGGSWGTDLTAMSCSLRCEVLATSRNNDLGFRCVLNE